MPSTTTTLPTSRQFVTQLLNSLPSLPLAGNAAAAAAAPPPTTNPLQNASEQVKKQLLSLQVLFPNEFVPALDLLDRRLVTRFRICDDGDDDDDDQKDGVSPLHHATPAPPQQDHTMTTPNPNPNPDPDPELQARNPPTPKPNPPPNTPNNTIHYVRSSAAHPRPSRFSTSFDTTTHYQVRLTAWTCSCPAFTFNAFPAAYTPPVHFQSHPHSLASNTPPPPLFSHRSHNMSVAGRDAGRDAGPRPAEEQEGVKEGEGEWVFGGVSLEPGMPPVCKHLLACVLVERCGGLFGGFVEERRVELGEAAGWAAGWGD
ncbi:hypothetical protein J1614_000478 [Plenodomus biglobosus]|nr:hypothetical protein J1614_000478 [Plenodomus biglobosus]